MKVQGRLWIRPCLIIASGIVVLLAHGFLFYSIRQHLRLPAAMLAGAVAIILIKHLGVFSSLRSLVGKRADKASATPDAQPEDVE